MIKIDLKLIFSKFWFKEAIFLKLSELLVENNPLGEGFFKLQFFLEEGWRLCFKAIFLPFVPQKPYEVRPQVPRPKAPCFRVSSSVDLFEISII